MCIKWVELRLNKCLDKQTNGLKVVKLLHNLGTSCHQLEKHYHHFVCVSLSLSSVLISANNTRREAEEAHVMMREATISKAGWEYIIGNRMFKALDHRVLSEPV